MAFRIVTGFTPLASAIAAYDMPRENEASISLSLGVFLNLRRRPLSLPGAYVSSDSSGVAPARILAKTRHNTPGGTRISPAATAFTMLTSRSMPGPTVGFTPYSPLFLRGRPRR